MGSKSRFSNFASQGQRLPSRYHQPPFMASWHTSSINVFIGLLLLALPLIPCSTRQPHNPARHGALRIRSYIVQPYLRLNETIVTTSGLHLYS